MGFRHKFAYSFFDFSAYKEFIVQGLGKSIVYVFLVTLIFTTITNLKTIDTFNTDISDVQQALVHSTPNFQFRNGELSMDSSEPVYYKHNGDILIIDTVNKTKSSALDSYSNGIYISSTQLVYRQNYTTIYTIDFSDYSDFTFTNKDAEQFLLVLKIIFPIVLLIFNPMITFAFNLAAVFIVLGPLSLFISSIMRVKLNYSRACTMSFYAMTFPLLLEALLQVAGIEIENFSFLFYSVTLIYCSLALKEIKKTDKSNINITQ